MNTALTSEYVILKVDSEEVDTKQFNTQNVEIYNNSDLTEIFEKNIRQVLDREMSEFEEKGSGWSLQQIIHLAVNINKLNPMRAGCDIDLPKEIEIKKACINVKCKNNQCFKYAVLACLNDVGKNASRSSRYKKYENDLNLDGINFPVKLKDISKFERQNDVSVHVYILKKYGGKYDVSPLYTSTFTREKSYHADLLLIQNYYRNEKLNEDEEQYDFFNTDVNYHYVSIQNFSRLTSKQLCKRNGKITICKLCQHIFREEKKLKAHEEDCIERNKCKVILPSEDDRFLRFKNFNKKERVPVIVYADFECLIEPRKENQNERIVSNHKAFSIGFYVKYSHD